MNEKQRTAIIGAIAVLVLGFGAVRLFRGGAQDDTVGVEHRDKGNVGHVASAAPTDPRILYKPILDADPFKSRLFTAKRPPGRDRGGNDDGGDRPPRRGETTGAPAPGYVGLRLTCIDATTQGVEGLLEERDTGKGIFVKKGQKIGDCTIADVTSSALLVQFAMTIAGTSSASTSKKIEFGDRLDLKQIDLALSAQFKDLGPIKSSTAAVGSEGWNGQPPLTTERAKNVLEELRRKRRKSLGLPDEEAPPADKPPEGDKPKEADKPKEPGKPEADKPKEADKTGNAADNKPKVGGQ